MDTGIGLVKSLDQAWLIIEKQRELIGKLEAENAELKKKGEE